VLLDTSSGAAPTEMERDEIARRVRHLYLAAVIG
jgi:hypothetical protein